jgi:hypothetical protein
MTDFSIGDRVKLADPENWKQPYRKLGNDGRLATVTSIVESNFRDPIKIEFDVKRKGATHHTIWLKARDITLTDEDRPLAGIHLHQGGDL